jgi:hypothetical protein
MRWIYRVGTGLFIRDVKMQVMDNENSYYLVKFAGGNLEGSVILQSDVDLSIVGYSRAGVEKLGEIGAFQSLPRIQILKSPVLTGSTWSNEFGEFTVLDSEYEFMKGGRLLKDCILLQLRDTSDARNDIIIKKGTGIVSAGVYIDNLGKLNLSLKSFEQ